MAIPITHYELFKTGSDFSQIRFLDNFYTNVNVDEEPSVDILKFLTTSIYNTSNDYVKRSALIILCDLTLNGTITNSFATIGQLNDFISTTKGELQVLALKYISHFAEARTAAIEQKLKECSDSPNGDVASQAYFALGLYELAASNANDDKEEMLLSVISAQKYFKACLASTENRDDAQFYILFTEWVQALLSNNVSLSSEKYNELKQALSLRILYEHSELRLVLEFLIFRLLQSIEASLAIVTQSQQWLEVTARIKELYELSVNVDSLKITAALSESQTNKLFTELFMKFEDNIYKKNLLSEKQRLGKIHSEDSQLKTFIEHLLSLFPDDLNQSGDNPDLLAMLASNLGMSEGLRMYHSIGDKSVSPDVITALGTFLRKNSNGNLPFRTGSVQGSEILERLMNEIKSALPEYSSEKMQVFSNILEEVIRYSINTFIGNDRQEFSFLFTEALGGKGADALEVDLQDSMLNFFRHSKISDGLDHEKTKFVDGGRVDIVYKRDLITIPIELKKSLVRPQADELEANYIAQAQTYTAGYNQLGLFAVLELSDKSIDPPPNIRDWFHIHHLQPSSSLPIRFPDYVVSVIIPGNRTLPSERSTYGR